MVLTEAKLSAGNAEPPACASPYSVPATAGVHCAYGTGAGAEKAGNWLEVCDWIRLTSSKSFQNL